jgi:hypothetical protein
VGGLYAHHAAARSNGADLDHATLGDLEKRIASGDAPNPVWLAYGRRLAEDSQFARAALAFGRVVQVDPYNRPARFEYVIALAKASDTETLFQFLRDQVYVEPLLAVELLARPELQPFMGEPRFETLLKEARAQSMD